MRKVELIFVMGMVLGIILMALWAVLAFATRLWFGIWDLHPANAITGIVAVLMVLIATYEGYGNGDEGKVTRTCGIGAAPDRG